MKKALKLLFLLPLAALLNGCGDDPAPAEAPKAECQIEQLTASETGFSDGICEYTYRNNNLINLSGWLELNFAYAGDSIVLVDPEDKVREVAFLEGSKIVRHNVITNTGTGARTEIRRQGTLTYNGSQLTKISYQNSEYRYTANNSKPTIVPSNRSEINYKYDAAGNITNIENITIPTGGGVPAPFKTVILTYSDSTMPNSGHIAHISLRYNLFNSYLLGFYNPLKMYNKIPLTMGYTDRSQVPSRTIGFTYTPTIDAKGNIVKIKQVSSNRTINFAYTYKCP